MLIFFSSLYESVSHKVIIIRARSVCYLRSGEANTNPITFALAIRQSPKIYRPLTSSIKAQVRRNIVNSTMMPSQQEATCKAAAAAQLMFAL